MKSLKEQFENLLLINKLDYSIKQKEINDITDKVLFQCNKCKKEWYIEAYKIINSTHVCRGNYTKEQVQRMIYDLGLNVEIVGRFISLSSSTHLRCNDCKKEWWAPPRSIINYGHKCKSTLK